MRAVLSLLSVLLLAILSIRPAAAADVTEFAWQPHPGAALPLDAGLTDEQGRPTTLGAYFTGHPVVLILEYLGCKTLCGVTIDGIFGALDSSPLEPGRDFELVAVSIDPRDTPADAASAKAKHLAAYAHPGGAAAVHFLTGREQETRRIAGAVGFPYRYDRELDQYVHPAGFVVAAGNGTISRYILGAGPTAAELQSALADAAQNRSGPGLLTRFVLLCSGTGAPLGRYTVPIEAAFALANLGGLVVLIAVFAAIRRRRHG